MIQAPAPQSYYNPNPYAPLPSQLQQQPFQPPHGPPPQQQPQQQPQQLLAPQPQPSPQVSTSPPRNKRKAPGSHPIAPSPTMSSTMPSTSLGGEGEIGQHVDESNEPTMPPPKKSRTNTPWTPAEEQRLKVMRDAGNSWGEIAKVTRRRRHYARSSS